MVVMLVVVIVGAPRTVIVFRDSRELLLAPRPPQHPQRHADDDDPGGELEVGLQSFAIDAPPEVHTPERDHPDDQGVGERCAEPQQHRLADSSPHRDDERRHHRL